MLTFTTKEAVGGSEEIPARGACRSLAGARPEVRIRPMHEVDLERILEFRAVVSWAADARAFDLLHGVKEARRMVVEADGAPRTLVGMVGADRSALMLATLRLHPGWGLVARNASGRIKGYLIRSASGGGTRVGPFIAAILDAARALLACALDKQSKVRAVPVSLGDAYVEIVVPVKDGPAHGLLNEFGFVGREDRLRMELGEAPHVEGLQTYGTTPYLAT